MLAYAANSPRPAGRAGSPKALTLIIVGHAVLVAVVMTAKMDLGPGTSFEPIDIIRIRTPPPPSPTEPQPQPEPQPQTQPSPQEPFIDNPTTIVDMSRTDTALVELGPIIRDLPPVGGGATVIDPPRHEPIKVAALFRTPESAIKPPYPNDKLRDEEEATLRLRLTIDTRGRVTAVDPVGAADPSFLEAARRHIIRAWRYKPATEDGVAVPSTMVINLSFRLEDA